MFIVGDQQLTFCCQCVWREQVFSEEKNVKVLVHADLQTHQVETLYSSKTLQMNCGVKLAFISSKKSE